MNIKKRGLGKGLSDLGLGALLGDLKTPVTPINHFESVIPSALVENNVIPADGQLKKLPIHVLKPGKTPPRKSLAPDALEELADSIRD